ncbi:hypothetical protein DV711_05185 [Motiliproteus coralliicola]|uniref:Lipoprotein with Yx(FWY)xxD motif n=1 Tax=Motiliproteus coralliicola TaxID=2283196 RepID=A0A369WS87_9GAMM|nr:hypothetical protein [Motiliproteus coralliicola]RDE24968.1 hypothetical protein DV711_05185 [Motiliproteus coralliicola]
MKPTTVLLPIVLASGLAACASTDTKKTTLPADKQQTEQGVVWRTPEGMTLYTFAKDTEGQSNCYGPCAEKWPPYIAADGAKPQGAFDLTTREDGSRQWRLAGQPLYTWFKDQRAGDTSGHGVKNIWFSARADDVPVKVYSKDGVRILTDERQFSLYTFAKDQPGQSNCYQKCAKLWPPLTVAEGAVASGPYSIVARKDGTQQWALNGLPLYTWVKDTQPGDISGDGVKGLWNLAVQP